jgi:CRP-like cAMP-binding protein
MSTILENLAGHEVRRFAPGETVLEQGDKAGVLLVLIDGAVEVVKDGVPVDRVTEPGAVLGEISALLDVGHSAQVTAAEPSSLYVIDDPRAFLQAHPEFHLHVSELLARRLNNMVRYLADVMAQFDGHDHIGMVGEIMDSLVLRQPRQRQGTGKAGARPGNAG